MPPGPIYQGILFRHLVRSPERERKSSAEGAAGFSPVLRARPKRGTNLGIGVERLAVISIRPID